MTELIALAGAIMSFFGHPAAAPNPPDRIDRGVIVSVSERPAIGMTITYVRLEIRARGTASHVVFQPYWRDDQFVPAVGSLCIVDYHHVPDSSRRPDEPYREFMIADRIACDTGRWEG